MTLYWYQAIDRGGASVAGELHCDGQAEAVSQLVAQGLTPIDVRPARAGLLASLNRPVDLGAQRWTDRNILAFCREIGSFLAAGLTLSKALSLYADTQSDKKIKRRIVTVFDEVRSGNPLSDALKSANLTHDYVLAIVRAGEEAGELEQALQQLASLLEAKIGFRDALGAKLIYPAILLITVIAAAAIILFIVMPGFQELFEDFGSQPPPITQAAFALSHLLNTHGPLLALAMAVLVILVVLQMRSDQGRQRLAHWAMRLPGLGTQIILTSFSIFLRVMATCLAAGLDLERAVAIGRRSVRNPVMISILADIHGSIRAGAPLSEALQSLGLAPPLAVQFVHIGEQTGELAAMAAQASTKLESQALMRAQRFMAAFVPAVTAGLGGLVALLVASVVLGIFGLTGA